MTFAKVVLLCGVCLPAVAACGDATGPRLADPQRVALHLDVISGLLGSEAIETGAQLSYSFPAAVTGTPSGGIFPVEALGTTYKWNLATGRYEAAGREGDPAKVRFHLYARDATGVTPADPLAWIGNMDFADVSADMPALGVGLHTGIGIVVDYTVSGSAAYPTSTWALEGAFGGIRKVLEFDGTLSSDAPLNSVLDVAFRDSMFDVDGRLTYTFTYDGYSSSSAVDFRFRLDADEVLVTGSSSFSSCVPYGECGGGRLTITVNDRPFATIEIDAQGRETRRADLSPDEELALNAILRAMPAMRAGFGRLVTPASQFLAIDGVGPPP